MAVCTWTIVTNTRTLTITGEGSPVIVGGNARCIGIFGSNINLIKLSGEADGFCAFTSETIVSSSSANCQGIDASQKFDCINGNCLPSSSHNTIGKYTNLAACESNCSNSGTNCNGECVSKEQQAALDRAIAEARARMACE